MIQQMKTVANNPNNLSLILKMDITKKKEPTSDPQIQFKNSAHRLLLVLKVKTSMVSNVFKVKG